MDLGIPADSRISQSRDGKSRRFCTDTRPHTRRRNCEANISPNSPSPSSRPNTCTVHRTDRTAIRFRIDSSPCRTRRICRADTLRATINTFETFQIIAYIVENKTNNTKKVTRRHYYFYCNTVRRSFHRICKNPVTRKYRARTATDKLERNSPRLTRP